MKTIEYIDEALAAIPTVEEIDEFFFNGTPRRWANFGLEFRYKVKELAKAQAKSTRQEAGGKAMRNLLLKHRQEFCWHGNTGKSLSADVYNRLVDEIDKVLEGEPSPQAEMNVTPSRP